MSLTDALGIVDIILTLIGLGAGTVLMGACGACTLAHVRWTMDRADYTAAAMMAVSMVYLIARLAVRYEVL